MPHDDAPPASMRTLRCAMPTVQEWGASAMSWAKHHMKLTRKIRRRANREVQTVNWEGGGEGAVERGVKSSLKRAHRPRIRGKKGAQTVN